MKKIDIESAKAFMEARKFKSSNTEVVVLPNVTVFKLFGNEIAYRYNCPDKVLSITNCGYQTMTTKARLNAILSHYDSYIYQRKGKWILGFGDSEFEWDGELIDVNMLQNKYICGSCGEYTNQYVYSEDRDIDECPTCYDLNSQLFIGSTRKSMSI